MSQIFQGILEKPENLLAPTPMLNSAYGLIA